MPKRCVRNTTFLLGLISLKHNVLMCAKLGQRLVMESKVIAVIVSFPIHAQDTSIHIFYQRPFQRPILRISLIC